MHARTQLQIDEERKQRIDESLDESLKETFPASDPISPANPSLDEQMPGKAAHERQLPAA
jgi:hypothetical protein